MVNAEQCQHIYDIIQNVVSTLSVITAAIFAAIARNYSKKGK